LTVSDRRVFDRFESTRLIVEVPQVVLHEADQPDVIGGLLHAHLLPANT
jgi:hypothetical protein